MVPPRSFENDCKHLERVLDRFLETFYASWWFVCCPQIVYIAIAKSEPKYGAPVSVYTSSPRKVTLFFGTYDFFQYLRVCCSRFLLPVNLLLRGNYLRDTAPTPNIIPHKNAYYLGNVPEYFHLFADI